MRVWVQLPSWVQTNPASAGFFMYYTYLLYSEAFNRYYVGHCEDINQRLNRHNLRKVPSTKAYAPWKLMYTEKYTTRSEASQRERVIKSKKSRTYIEKLISGGTR